VLTTLPRAKMPAVLDALAASGLPNLFLPRPDAIVYVPSIPVLGTGKLDLRAAKAMALDALGTRA